MPVEIERKFLVASDAWKGRVTASRVLSQFYLSLGERSSVRVRIEGRSSAWITVKSASSGIARHEFEYAIPVEDARQMLPLAEGAVIVKVRYIVPHKGLDWEVDVFAGENLGLIIAELEIEQADQPLDLPPWLGREVSDDRRYYNASLAQRPFGKW